MSSLVKENNAFYKRLQVSDYRIIYTVDAAACELIITSIKHRRESYRKKK
ncbi:type II toxin-antitoxin system RelE family toxin [Wolbachia endosymbiont of Brugia pahangi]|nr:hypothetical protein [Wolbachia endosymbiont of Brugia pahangi]QIT36703.1 hypothetical protein WBP_0632 [Wolbachia endosymbiont of Brugia pahangi]